MTAAPIPLPSRKQLPPSPATATPGHHAEDNALARLRQLRRRRRRLWHSSGQPMPHESMDLLWAGHISSPR